MTPKRDVYSVMGVFVGSLSNEARIVRRRSEDENRPRLQPPPKPRKIAVRSVHPFGAAHERPAAWSH
ncbi:MAG: hypothetical protein MZV64_33020 [Ignavibacteriales bacterium]|nr:hypothetical protein [Ignavibacteriales bacterium]